MISERKKRSACRRLGAQSFANAYSALLASAHEAPERPDPGPFIRRAVRIEAYKRTYRCTLNTSAAWRRRGGRSGAELWAPPRGLARSLRCLPQRQFWGLDQRSRKQVGATFWPFSLVTTPRLDNPLCRALSAVVSVKQPVLSLGCRAAPTTGEGRHIGLFQKSSIYIGT